MTFANVSTDLWWIGNVHADYMTFANVSTDLYWRWSLQADF